MGGGIPILSILLKKEFNCFAYEPFASDSQMLFAKSNGIQIHTKLSENETFDVITMIEVIEHLPVLRDVIPKVVERLKPNGVLIVTTPNGVRFSQWFNYVLMRRAHPVVIEKFLRTTNTYEGHTREFTSKELEKTLHHFGLETEASQLINMSAPHNEFNEYLSSLGKPIVHRTPGGWLKNVFSQIPCWRRDLICVARKPK